MSSVRTALYQRLIGDSTLTGMLSATDAIYHRVAPPSAQAPYVVFHKQAGTPRYAMTASIENELWLVKGITTGGSADVAEQIAARIDTRLKDAPLTISGRTLLYLRRESDVDYGEPDGGETWHHVGALYRLITE